MDCAWLIVCEKGEEDTMKALVLAGSLRNAKTCYPIVVMCPKGAKSGFMKHSPQLVDHILEYDLDKADFVGITPQDFALLSSFKILNANKCVWLSLNTLVVANPDDIFVRINDDSKKVIVDESKDIDSLPLFGFKPSLELYEYCKQGLRSNTNVSLEQFWYNNSSGNSQLGTWLKPVGLRNVYLKDGHKTPTIKNDDELTIVNFVEAHPCDQSIKMKLDLDNMGYVEKVSVSLWEKLYLQIKQGINNNTNRLPKDELLCLIEEDSILPSDIRPCDGGQPIKSLQEAEVALITGATGTLAAYILQHVSKLPQITKIYCVVRAIPNETLENRVVQSLKEKSLWNETDFSKVACIEGNISQENLGVSEKMYSKLAREVDVVFHSAAKLHWVENYKKHISSSPNEVPNDIRTVNVFGTRNILRFACDTRTKHVYHASSILAVATEDGQDEVPECWPKAEWAESQIYNFEYGISKYVSERLVHQAVERGVPCKVFRFPYFCGDRRTGRFDFIGNHHILRLLSFLKLGLIEKSECPFILLPSDQCAELSLRIFFNEDAPSDVYNVWPPNPQPEVAFTQLAREEYGINLEVMDEDEFLQLVYTSTNKSLPLYPMRKLYNRKKHDDVFYIGCHWYGKGWKMSKDPTKYFISKKMLKYIPDYESQIESSLEMVRRDLNYARSLGLFKKFGIGSK